MSHTNISISEAQDRDQAQVRVKANEQGVLIFFFKVGVEPESESLCERGLHSHSLVC